MTLPDDLRDSLSEEDFAAVQSWWESLSPDQQNDLFGDSDSDSGFELEERSLPPIPDEADPDDELFPYYDYLINHEFRTVNFVAGAEAKSSYRIVSSYIASLGSDDRHGQSGRVR